MIARGERGRDMGVLHIFGSLYNFHIDSESGLHKGMCMAAHVGPSYQILASSSRPHTPTPQGKEDLQTSLALQFLGASAEPFQCEEVMGRFGGHLYISYIYQKKTMVSRFPLPQSNDWSILRH